MRAGEIEKERQNMGQSHRDNGIGKESERGERERKQGWALRSFPF